MWSCFCFQPTSEGMDTHEILILLNVVVVTILCWKRFCATTLHEVLLHYTKGKKKVFVSQSVNLPTYVLINIQEINSILLGSNTLTRYHFI